MASTVAGAADDLPCDRPCTGTAGGRQGKGVPVVDGSGLAGDGKSRLLCLTHGTQIMRVVQQGETFAVQSQKSENGQMMKCNIVLQEMGGKYENQYAAAMLGNMAQCKYAPGELVAVTLRFTTHEHNGQVYQDILVTDIEKVKG